MTSNTLMAASQQWRTRPSDQRFTSLTEMSKAVTMHRDNSRATVVSSRSLSAEPIRIEGSGPLNDSLLFVNERDEQRAMMTHWAFGQLAQRAGAPPAYLRDLPAPIAADCINYGIKFNRSIDDVGVMTYKGSDGNELLAVTGPGYGRVWNATIIDALIRRFGDGITGDFRVPGEFGKAVKVTKENTTLYASDRDMFVFLADEKNRIEIHNRRDGKSGSLARGFFMWNSEVGKSSFGLAMFLFDYACCNRIVWGAQDYAEIRLRHSASAPDKFLHEVQPMIKAYANASTAPVVKAIEAAQKQKVDDVEEFLKKRFTVSQVKGITAAHMADEQRPMETIWDAATGITAYARAIEWQDERVKLEREAGKVLKLAQ